MYRKSFFPFISFLAALAMAIAVAPATRADEVSHARVVRLSFVEGDVAYQRAGSTWQRAMMNQPIQQDFSLRTDSGYAEVEFETGLVIRLGQNTQIDFTELSLIDGHKVTSLKLDHGTVIASAKLANSDQLSIAAGNLNVTVPKAGRFRVDAAESQDWVTVFHGKVEVVDGQSTSGLESGKMLNIGGAANAVSIAEAPEPDAFDKWVDQRDKSQDDSRTNASDYVSGRNYSYGTGDLFNYGLWFDLPGYGTVWQPYGMGAAWMPFGNGQWMFDDPGMGWMWTSFEPWGWLPYHYGGWVNMPGRGWFWVPQNLGTFHVATANFVSVGNQMGWTPTILPPTNPGKFKGNTNLPVQVVFAGGASNGVIAAGPRGQLNSGATLRMVSGPAANFAQSEPATATLAASGVTVTGRAPVRPVTTAIAAGSHGSMPGTMSSANGHPIALAPHSPPAPVARAPITLATSNAGHPGSGKSSGGNAGGSAHAASSNAVAAHPTTTTTSKDTAPVKH